MYLILIFFTERKTIKEQRKKVFNELFKLFEDEFLPMLLEEDHLQGKVFPNDAKIIEYHQGMFIITAIMFLLVY